MTWQFFISALALGFASSFHCVGMCGAFAFSLPTNQLGNRTKLAGLALYNVGRIVTYVVLGIIFGLLGETINLAGLQKIFSISAGIVVIVIIVWPLVMQSKLKTRRMAWFHAWLQKLMGKLLQQKSLPAVWLLGMANGLLPCGMVYFALTGAMATGHLGSAAIFMTAFGLATIPLMFMVSWFGYMINLKARRLVTKMVPFLMLLMAALLMLRGFGGDRQLHSFNDQKVETISCHP